MTQSGCQAVLQSNTGQRGMHFVLTCAAVHWYWVSALLYEEQVPKGLSAMTQASCQAVLQSNSGQ